jgi:hypothetical protein
VLCAVCLASICILLILQAIVPIVFFLCRIWGSVRILIHFAAPSNSAAASAASGWLQTMQAIFDPSLGFFNAVIFVFMSEQDRDAFFKILFNVKVYRYIRTSCVCTLLWGTPDVHIKSPVDSSGRDLVNKRGVRYQGEDSEVSVGDECDGMGESSSSYFDFNESSATYNNNTY